LQQCEGHTQTCTVWSLKHKAISQCLPSESTWETSLVGRLNSATEHTLQSYAGAQNFYPELQRLTIA